jgi:hypothetical protein
VVCSVTPLDPFQMGSPSSLAKSSGGHPWYWGPDSLAILLLGKSVESKLLGRNQRPTVPGVQDPKSSSLASCQTGGRSWSPIEWQNRYSYGIVGSATGFKNMNMGPKASMIKFRNPTVVPTV